MISFKEVDKKSEWQDCEASFNPHTFLQSWEWGEYQKILGHKIFRIGIYIDDKLSGIALAFKVNAKRGKYLLFPYGPLINWDKEELFKEFVNHIKKIGEVENVHFIRINPLIMDSIKYKELFQKSGFKDAPIHMVHPEMSWILDIKKSEDNLLKEMKKRTRYSVNKAIKDGVEIIKTDKLEYLDDFYNLLQETAKRQGFVAYSKEYIKKEIEIFNNSNKMLLYFARYKNEIISTAMIIFMNNSGFYHHGASIRKYSNITASELIQWEAIKEAKNRGMQMYNFWGVVDESQKNHPWVGLSRFKKGFGGYSEKYLHCQDLVLSPFYLLNYSVEKIRKLKRGY